MFLRDLGNCGQSHHQLQPIDIDFNEFYTQNIQPMHSYGFPRVPQEQLRSTW